MHLTMKHNWLILSAICLLSFFQYGSLVALEIIVPRLIEQLEMTAMAAGLACSIAAALATMIGPLAETAVYMSGDMPGDMIATIIGGIVMVCGLIFLSLSKMAAPVYISMIILGIGRGLPMVAMMTLIMQHFRKTDYILANGVASIGGSLGLFITPLLVEMCVYFNGWRVALMIVGAVYSCFSFAAAYLMKKNNENNETDVESDVADECLQDVDEKMYNLVGIIVLTKEPTFIFDLIAFTFINTAFYGWMLFLFTFLTSVGLDFLVASAVSSCGGAGSLFGTMLFGPLLVGKIKQFIKLSPRLLITISTIIGGVTLLLYRYSTTHLSLAALAFFTGCFTGTTTQVYMALIDQTFSKECVYGAAVGLYYLVGGIGMLCGGPLTGLIYDKKESFDQAFGCLAVFQFIGCVINLRGFLLETKGNNQHCQLQEENDEDYQLLEDV